MNFNEQNVYKTNTKNRWILLSIISIGTLSATLDGSSTTVIFPAVAKAFRIDVSTVLWITVAYWVTGVGLMLSMGWIGDVAGRRRVFITGSAIFVIGILLSALSQNIEQLITFRVLQGIGSAMLLASLNALIAANFPNSERGKAMGLSGAVAGLGLTIGPLMGGYLLDILDWRAVFYARVPLGITGLVLAWWILPQDRIEGTQFDLDYVGIASLFGTLASLLLIVNQGARLGFYSIPVISMTILATICLPALIWSERKSNRPILDIGLFRNRRYALSILLQTTHYLAHGGILLVAPFFMMNSLGFSATKIGMFLAAFSFGRMFVAPIAGRLSDKYGPRPFLLIGNVLLGVGLLSLSFHGANISDLTLLIGLLTGSIGSSFFEPVITSTIMGSVPENRLGTASAFVAVGRQTAFAVGVTVAGAIFTVRERAYLSSLLSEGVFDLNTRIEAVAGAFGDTMLAGVVLAFLAVCLSLTISNRQQLHQR